jgi:hypothetical protein
MDGQDMEYFRQIAPINTVKSFMKRWMPLSEIMDMKTNSLVDLIEAKLSLLK